MASIIFDLFVGDRGNFFHKDGCEKKKNFKIYGGFWRFKSNFWRSLFDLEKYELFSLPKFQEYVKKIVPRRIIPFTPVNNVLVLFFSISILR